VFPGGATDVQNAYVSIGNGFGMCEVAAGSGGTSINPKAVFDVWCANNQNVEGKGGNGNANGECGSNSLDYESIGNEASITDSIVGEIERRKCQKSDQCASANTMHSYSSNVSFTSDSEPFSQVHQPSQSFSHHSTPSSAARSPDTELSTSSSQVEKQSKKRRRRKIKAVIDTGRSTKDEPRTKLGEIYKCANCGTRETPAWRRDLEGKELLCNACGL